MKKLITEKNKLFIISNLGEILNRLKKSEIGKRIAKGAFWSLGSSIFSQGLMLLSSIIIARLLGKNSYGEFGMIRSTVNAFIIFAGFGLGITSTKFISEFLKENKEKVGKIIALSNIFSVFSALIVSVLFFIFAPYISDKIINSPHLVNQLRIGGVVLFFSSINGSQSGILIGFEAFKTIAKINLIASLIAFPIQFIFTYYYGLVGSILGFASNFLILNFLNYRTILKFVRENEIYINYSQFWEERKILFNFSIPSFLSGILVSPIIWLCNAMLVNQPNGYGELAILDVSNQWRNLVLFIPTALSQIVLPLLASSQSDKFQFKKILMFNIFINFSVSIIFFAFIFIFSDLILSFYGTDFNVGIMILRIVTFTAVLVAINNVIGQAIVSKGKVWIGLFFNFIWASLVYISSYYFIKIGLGGVGLALGMFFGYFFHTIIQTIFLFYSDLRKIY
jgi:O-antigen/teichoic acid export membrane protein